MMKYDEYKQMIKSTSNTADLEYKLAFRWLHPQNLPLAVVSIPEEAGSVVWIPDRAFNKYGNLVSVIGIHWEAFRGKTKITDIILPSGLTEIPEGAFYGCSRLKRITIPKGVRVIEKEAFSGCDMLEDVYYEGTREEWKKLRVVHDMHEIEFGDMVTGTPVHEIKSERLVHIPGNDALLTANIHFHCSIPEPKDDEREEIKATEYPEDLIKDLENIDIYAPVGYSFGRPSEAQQQPNRYGVISNRLITRPECDFAPEAVRQVLCKWHDRINKLEAPNLCVRGACIYCGYGEKNYRFKSAALNTDDGRLEYYAKDILTDLRDAGCNYGRYEGFLD